VLLQELTTQLQSVPVELNLPVEHRITATKVTILFSQPLRLLAAVMEEK